MVSVFSSKTYGNFLYMKCSYIYQYFVSFTSTVFALATDLSQL